MEIVVVMNFMKSNLNIKKKTETTDSLFHISCPPFTFLYMRLKRAMRICMPR